MYNEANPRPSSIFLSPHFDDVVYSCSGLLAQQAQDRGQHPLVITVCGGAPRLEEPISELARRFHADMGLSRDISAQEMVGLRQREDGQVLHQLGVDHCWLEYPDAIYRGTPAFYPTLERLLSGDIHPDDCLLSEQLPYELLSLHQRFPDIIWYAPLGIGRHIDHQLVSAAAIFLLWQGAHVIFYEDFPYVLREGQLGARLEELEIPLTPTLVDISDVLSLRIEATYGYPSQIAVNFGEPGRIPRAIAAYTSSLLAHAHAERYWHPFHA